METIVRAPDMRREASIKASMAGIPNPEESLAPDKRSSLSSSQITLQTACKGRKLRLKDLWKVDGVTMSVIPLWKWLLEASL